MRYFRHILEHYGCTGERLRAVFTAKKNELSPEGEAWLHAELKRRESELNTPEKEQAFRHKAVSDLRKARERLDDAARSRIQAGRTQNFRTWRWFGVADLAYRGHLNPESRLPLTLAAQQKVKIKDLHPSVKAELDKLQKKTGREIIAKNDKGERYLNDASLFEVPINMVRPVIRRRLASLTARYKALDPYFAYYPRDNTPVGKIKAAALSARADIWSEQYDINNCFGQSILEALLHGRSYIFQMARWETEKRPAFDPAGGVDGRVRTIVTREGFPIFTPHASRVAVDDAYAASTLNTDTGCTWALFWNVVPHRTVTDNPAYYNRKDLCYSAGVHSTLTQNALYFAQYYANSEFAVNPPDAAASTAPAEERLYSRFDRKSEQGFGNEGTKDAPVLLTTYYEKLVPREFGLGEYPYPLWLRRDIANDGTTVYAEWLPGCPVVVNDIGGRDNDSMSLSLALEILPFDDQIQGLFTQMVYLQRIGSLLMIGLDVDFFDPEQLAQIEGFIKSGSFQREIMTMRYRFADKKRYDILRSKTGGGDEPIKTFKADLRQSINELLKAITTMIDMLDRAIMSTPQERGQYTTKETAATEVLEVSKTRDAIYESHAEGPDRAHAALARMFHLSVESFGSQVIPFPAAEGWSDEDIEAAGFIPAAKSPTGEPGKRLLTFDQRGDPTEAFAHEFLYNHRDASSRPASHEVATVIMQFIPLLLQDQGMRQKIGDEQLGQMVTEAFRMAGSNFNLKLGPDPDPTKEAIQIFAQAAQSVGVPEAQVVAIAQAMQQAQAQVAAPQPPTPPTSR